MLDPYPGVLLLTSAQVARMLGMTRSTFYRLRQEDTRFPKPKGAGNRTRYLKEEVFAWLKCLPDGKDEPPKRLKP